MRKTTFEEFDVLLEKMQVQEKAIGESKGREYGLDYRTSNFHRLGEEVKVTCPKCGCRHAVGPFVILWVYLKKHLDAILSYVNGRRDGLSETIDGRILDTRVYTALFEALVEEERYEVEVEIPDIQKKIEETGEASERSHRWQYIPGLVGE